MDYRNKPRRVFEEIKLDLLAKKYEPTLINAVRCLLFSYNMRPLMLLRLRNVKGIRHIVRYILRYKYMIEFDPSLKLGAPFRMEHPRGIILSAIEIGDNCMIGQWVTIGGNNLQEKNGVKTPSIGNNVQIYAGAVVAGPIRIGHDVIIAANATITKDVPDNTLIYNQTGTSTRKVVVPGFKGSFYYE